MVFKSPRLKSVLLSTALASGFSGCMPLTDAANTFYECRFRLPQNMHVGDRVPPFATVSKISADGVSLAFDLNPNLSRLQFLPVSDVYSSLRATLYIARVLSISPNGKTPSAQIHLDQECGF
jgi:hypothetical protein